MARTDSADATAARAALVRSASVARSRATSFVSMSFGSLIVTRVLDTSPSDSPMCARIVSRSRITGCLANARSSPASTLSASR